MFESFESIQKRIFYMSLPRKIGGYGATSACILNNIDHMIGIPPLKKGGYHGGTRGYRKGGRP